MGYPYPCFCLCAFLRALLNSGHTAPETLQPRCLSPLKLKKTTFMSGPAKKTFLLRRGVEGVGGPARGNWRIRLRVFTGCRGLHDPTMGT